MKMFLTSRTAALTYQDCPRRRFYLFHIFGTGITGTKLSPDTFIGTTVHRGLQNLLEHARVEHEGDVRTLKRGCINQSVSVAKMLFEDMLANSAGIAQKAGDYTPYEFIREEAWNLCEALIRSYAIWRLPQFGEFYEVLEVEKEEEFWFEEVSKCERCYGTGVVALQNVIAGDPNIYCKDCNGSGEIGGICFQAKADGLLRGRQDNKLYVLSFKTGRQFTDLTMKQIMHDMQGMSEIASIEDRLNRAYQAFKVHWKQFKDFAIYQEFAQKHRLTKAIVDYFVYCVTNNIQDIECEAVQYEYLLKGMYKEDPWNSGIFKWQNPLIHPYKNEGVMNIFSGQVNGMDYKWKHGQGRLPKGWSKIDIWDDMGVELWIDTLMRHEIQPEEGDAFQNLFRGETVHRDREHILEWKNATFYQENRIRNYLQDLEAGNGLLAIYFPKHTNMCHNYYGYNNDCPFVIFCHENFSPEEMLEQGIFKQREPHHERERQLFQIKGRSK